MPRNTAIQVERRHEDFSRGIVSQLSPVGVRGAPPVLKSARNLLFRPRRGAAVRAGYRDSSTAILSETPTSLGKHYGSGGNRLFVATDDGAGGGHIYRHTSTANTLQTIPFTPTAQWWRFEMANGLLVGTQRGGAQPPIFWSPTNVAETWLTMVLPKPAAAPTFNADSAGGNLPTGKTFYYRVRWRYANGSSKTGPTSAAHPVTTPNLTVNLNIPLPGAPRTDYLGWTLERTAQNGTSSGPFFLVADGTAATYSDTKADSELGYEADETLHGEPVPMDGVLFYKGRLVGWYGSNLYVSQPIVANEGTGIFNWIGDLIYPVGKDDGDTIQSVLIQSDRLVIGKQRSVWTLEGDDTDSFRLSPRYQGAGFSGPRAACSLGGTIIFAAGDARLFSMRGNSVEPFGQEQVGDYLGAMDTTRDDEIVCVNYLGDLVLIWYVAQGSDDPADVLVYDLRFGIWSHFDGMPAADALVQNDRIDFNAATLLFADPTLRPPANTGAVANNPSFVVWLDKRNQSNYQWYMQKVGSDGTPAWGPNGIQVSNSLGAPADNYINARVVSDGAGGCIVLWNDLRNGVTSCDIYGQRFNSAGVAQWTAGGVLLQSEPAYSATYASLGFVVSDGAGGVVYSYRAPGTTGYFAQRLNASGAKQWGAGTKIGNADMSSFVGWWGKGVVDSSANTTCAWTNGNTIYMQKLNGSGAEQWGSSGVGVAIQTNANNGFYPIALCADAAGGTLLAFTDSPNSNTMAQRINASGAKQWGAGGVAVSTISQTNEGVAICHDGSNGCYVVWDERQFSGAHTLRVRRILSNGAPAWTPTALTGTSTAIEYRGIACVQDGNGACIVVSHYVNTSGTGGGVICGGVDGTGALLFATNSVIGTAFAIPSYAPAEWAPLVTDGGGGGIVFWTDDRTGIGVIAQRDVYGQRFDGTGAFRWTAGGVQLVNLLYEQQVRAACFTDAPESEVPPAIAAGYHVWCGLAGTMDSAFSDGSGGDGIPYELETHDHDDGLARYDKDYELIEAYLNRGAADLSVRVDTDLGATAVFPVLLASTAPRYNTGLTYNSGIHYAQHGRVAVFAGVPMGTIGRRARVTLSGVATEQVELGGFLLKAWATPQEQFS